MAILNDSMTRKCTRDDQRSPMRRCKSRGTPSALHAVDIPIHRQRSGIVQDHDRTPSACRRDGRQLSTHRAATQLQAHDPPIARAVPKRVRQIEAPTANGFTSAVVPTKKSKLTPAIMKSQMEVLEFMDALAQFSEVSLDFSFLL